MPGRRDRVPFSVCRVIQAPLWIPTQVTTGHQPRANVTSQKPKLGSTDRPGPSESAQDFGVRQDWFVQIPAPPLSPCLPPTTSLRLPRGRASATRHGLGWLATAWSKWGRRGPGTPRSIYLSRIQQKYQLVPTTGLHTTLTANSGGPRGHLSSHKGAFGGSVPTTGG